MRGYKKVHHVWFNDRQEWRPIGQTNRPVDIVEQSNAREVAFEAMMHPNVAAVMVVVVETALYSDIETRQEWTKTDYTVLV